MGAFTAGVIALSVAAVVSGCTPPDETDRPHVRIGYTRYLTMAPMFIAAAEGFFDEQGIDVELVAVRSAATSIPALTQGRLDVLPGPMSPSLFNAIYRGAPIRLVADKGSYLQGCSPTAFVVSPQIAAQATKVLPRRMGWGREPFTTFRVERALAGFGFDIDDVEQHTVVMASRYEAISAGGLDGGVLSEPFLGRFRNDGGTVWIDMKDVLPGAQFSVFAFGPRLLDDDPELGRRVAVALLKGARALNLGKTDRNIDILVEALAWERALLEEACWPEMRRDGRINTESIAEFQAWALERGDLDAIVPSSAYYDSTFIQYARETLDGSP